MAILTKESGKTHRVPVYDLVEKVMQPMIMVVQLPLPVDSKIRVSYIGYETQIYEDLPNGDIKKNFSLSDQMLEEVEILSTKEYKYILNNMSTIDLSMEKVKARLFWEKMTSENHSIMPGVQTGRRNVCLYVRGPDQNLILLDGYPFTMPLTYLPRI